MLIKKDKEPGWFFAEQKINNQWFIASGHSMFETIQRCLMKIDWLYPFPTPTLTSYEKEKLH